MNQSESFFGEIDHFLWQLTHSIGELLSNFRYEYFLQVIMLLVIAHFVLTAIKSIKKRR